VTASRLEVSGENALAPPKQYVWVILLGSFVFFIMGAVGFGAAADHSVTLGLSLFFGIFVGGVLVSFGLVSFLKRRRTPGVKTPPAGKSGKVIVFPLVMFILLLPVVLFKLAPNAGADQLGQAIGRLVATCFFPAIVTGIWINRSKNEWSWLGAGLRYLVFFVAFAVVGLAGRQPMK
jgi:hypothetical protein